MSRERELVAVIAETFTVDVEAVSAEAHLLKDLGADSVTLAELAGVLSARFGVALDADDLLEAARVGEVAALIGDRLTPSATPPPSEA